MYFLVQINNSAGYPYVTQNHKYDNDAWMRRQRDRAHGNVSAGDTLLFYCTGDVPTVPMTLAFSALVGKVSPDNAEFELSDLHWFPQPLPRYRILQLVDQELLSDAFRNCGAQGFNICEIDPASAGRVLQLVEREATEINAPIAGPLPGSPLDALIETKLEEWLVEHWNEIDFGLKLRIYTDNGEAVGQQYDTGEVGRIDLLCVDEDTNDLVILELKRGRPSDVVVGQLARYIGWTRANVAKGRRVRGIVLAPDFDSRLRYAASALPDTILLKYQTKFEIELV